MHLGSLESTQEARVALSYASSNSYASLVLSKLPKCIHNSIYANKHEPINNLNIISETFTLLCLVGKLGDLDK